MDGLFHRQWTETEHWFLAGAVLVAWVLLGLFLARILLHRLTRWASRSANKTDDHLVAALALPLRVLVLLSGALVAAHFSPLDADGRADLSQWLKVALLLLGVFLIDGLLQGLLKDLEKKQAEIRHSHVMFSALLHLAVWGIGLLMVLEALGISITPLLASLGVGSLAVALALQPVLANLFSGFYLLMDKPLRPGDFIRLETGEEGHVESVGWRTTRVRMLSNILVVVPNAKLTENRLHNYDLPDQECAVLVEVGVAYDSDLKRVEKVTTEVAREAQKTVEGAVAGFDPFIRYHTFADSSINFTVILRSKTFVDNYLLKHEFIKALHERFRKEKITIPFPQRTIEWRGGVGPGPI
ncbi:MAG TPA: mechanosensitive ion channel family protein [bacterium]|nr:mechanosensitive ion channel family protein [bacterium]